MLRRRLHSTKIRTGKKTYIAKTALVVGVNQYNSNPLRCCIRDVVAIQKKFEQLGFAVTLAEDPDERELIRLLTDFGFARKKGDLGIFYFAGQGVENHPLPKMSRGSDWAWASNF